MKHFISLLATLTLGGLYISASFAGQFVVELEKPIEPVDPDQLADMGITMDESFSAGKDSYAVISAADQSSLMEFLKKSGIQPEKLSEVLFVNTPTLGGGKPAGETPRAGHQVFVIERPIPGVGFFGLEKKKKISMGSNKAIAKLGDIIEWDHSYLTSEGTYCVYRADSPETLREHGALAGAPIGKITAVDQE